MNRVSLKNVKHSEFMSQETICFQCDIYFDNKKVGYARNDGRGGSTICSAYPEQRELFEQMSEYCESLPSIFYKELDFTIESSLEAIVDDAIGEYLRVKGEEKHLKQLNKNFEKGICIGSVDSYTITSFKRGGKVVPIKDILKTQEGVEYLVNYCKNLLSDGKTILNTNIPIDNTLVG